MDGKHVFELPLTEIGDVQGTKEDAILEFHVDDGTISQKEDALSSITFVIPDDNERFPGVFRTAVFRNRLVTRVPAVLDHPAPTH